MSAAAPVRAGIAGKQINLWVVTVAVMLATFMEILDTTVVNVSIPHISGNLGSTYEEGTWVVTSYLVSNAIVLPMAGWLANYFGRRRILLLCVAGFTATSVACGAATSLSWLIIFRVLQGLTGGGLQPLSQAILLEAFPREKHGHAMAAFGIGIILAPIIGPTLGGWITDNYSWRWIFYVNFPVGLLSLGLISHAVRDPDYIKRSAKTSVDLWGIGFLALGLGTLQVILDTGQRKDWFSSGNIRLLTVFCVIGLVAFIVRELLVSSPVVDLRALKDRAFATGVVLISGVGFTLYGSLVLLPMYLQTLLGYPSFQAGLALSPRGIGSLVMMPITGVLTTKCDPRKLVFVGFATGAWSMWRLAALNLNAGYWDIFWPQVVQGMAMSFMFIPLSAAAISHIAKERMGNATSIFNLMRNIGGSFGIAAMTTMIARRQQVHQNHLVERITAYDVSVQQTVHGLAAHFAAKGSDAYTALQRSYGALYGMLQQHAAMLAFVEAFWTMAVIFAAMLPFVFLLRNPPKRNKPALQPQTQRQHIPAQAEDVEEVHELIHA